MREFIGVYHADGGLVGEVRYVVGHLLHRVECALCEITHSPLRRKREWDSFVAGLDVPFRLYHLNELPPDVAEVVTRRGSPLLLARDEAGLQVVAGPDDLRRMDGSVPALADTIVRWSPSRR